MLGYIEGPIFSKAVLKCRWLLEHENLSKVCKYIGKFLNSISKWGHSLNFIWGGDFADLLDFSASNIRKFSRKNGSMCHLHFKTAFEKIGHYSQSNSIKVLVPW